MSWVHAPLANTCPVCCLLFLPASPHTTRAPPESARAQHPESLACGAVAALRAGVEGEVDNVGKLGVAQLEVAGLVMLVVGAAPERWMQGSEEKSNVVRVAQLEVAGLNSKRTGGECT